MNPDSFEKAKKSSYRCFISTLWSWRDFSFYAFGERDILLALLFCCTKKKQLTLLYLHAVELEGLLVLCLRRTRYTSRPPFLLHKKKAANAALSPRCGAGGTSRFTPSANEIYFSPSFFVAQKKAANAALSPRCGAGGTRTLVQTRNH